MRRIGWAAVLAALACTGIATPPSPEPPTPVAPPDPSNATPDPPSGPWPLFRFEAIPADAHATVRSTVAGLAVERADRFAVIATDRGLLEWDFRSDPAELPVDGLDGVRPTALAASPFDGAIFVVGDVGPKRVLERCDPGPRWACRPLFESDQPIHDPVAPFVRYDGEPRVFFGLGPPGSSRIVGVLATGGRVYEVTSPSGELGELTDAALRQSHDDFESPNVLKAASATPVGVDPLSGALWWQDGSRQVHRRAWFGTNWGDDEAPSLGSVGSCALAPNGWSLLCASPDGKTRLVDPVGGPTATLPAPDRTVAPPVLAPSGRALIAASASDDGVRIAAIPVADKLAWTRELGRAHPQKAELSGLAERGLVEARTDHQNLPQVYDQEAYDPVSRQPVFASIDGYLEVVNSGFLAVLLRTEREVSSPRLDAFYGAVSEAANHQGRLAAWADTGRQILAGDASSPDGQRAKDAAGTSKSAVLGIDVPWADFAARGPYAGDPALGNYFRAFKYADLIDPEPDELRILLAPKVVAAWRAWSETEVPFVQGSRHHALLDPGSPLGAYVRQDCFDDRLKEKPFELFPLGWGVDHEILNSTVERKGTAADCTVAGRHRYTGLDLLAGLGSAEARRLSGDEEQRFPGLKQAHDQLAARFGEPLHGDRVVDTWMRVVQLLGSDDAVPEGVAPSAWRARLMETALATWATYRHDTVLLDEGTGAEAGEGGASFEELTVEPPRGVVDPVPEAWASVGTMLDRLADLATTGSLARIRAELEATRDTSRHLGELAKRQIAGDPLAEKDYDEIQRYAGAIEHPELLFASATVEGGALPELGPMARIVDVRAWPDPTEGPNFEHVAVGNPRSILVLGSDRGVLIAARGGVYSYHEVASDHRMNDEEWQGQADEAPRPAWAVPDP